MSCTTHAPEATTNIERIGDVLVVTVDVSCSECGQSYAFTGLERGISTNAPTVSGNGLRARLPLVSLSQPVDVRCPDCEHLLYGAPQDDAPSLDRPVKIDAVECAAGEHVVRYRDGVELRVSGGQVWAK